MPQTKFGAFNQGNTPKIAVFNKAVTPLGVNLDKLIAAMQIYIDKFIVPVWATPAKLVKSKNFIAGAWAIVFLDDADDPDALAYHELTPDGLPISKVFVRTTIDNGDLVSVSTSHELVEMLVDPAINLMTTGPDEKTVYAYESADPVEALTFNVNGIPMSDFVYPSYFEEFRKTGSVKFDQLGKVKRPFQILADGYQIIFKGGKWSQVYGSLRKKHAFAREKRLGHRSEERKLGKLKRAEPAKIRRGQARKTRAMQAPQSQVSRGKARVLAGVAGRKRRRR
ncbi:MAG TPA: hypothetical protein VE046_01730 [Steroidobacteraceae bacterium]|nr:hypothetical protein [Steroidobacteraceae bacterium]